MKAIPFRVRIINIVFIAVCFFLYFRSSKAFPRPNYGEQLDGSKFFGNEIPPFKTQILRRKERDAIEELMDTPLMLHGDPHCDAKIAVAKQAYENTITQTKKVDDYALFNDYVRQFELSNGRMSGMKSLSHQPPIDVICTENEVSIHGNLILENVKTIFSYKAPNMALVDDVWASADDVKLDISAIILGSSANFPAVRILEMQLKEMKNFKYSKEVADVFESTDKRQQTKLFKAIFTRALENLLKEVVWKQLQLLISQSWYTKGTGTRG